MISFADKSVIQSIKIQDFCVIPAVLAYSHLSLAIHQLTMKEVIVKSATEVKIIDSPIPTPNDDQVCIKVDEETMNQQMMHS